MRNISPGRACRRPRRTWRNSPIEWVAGTMSLSPRRRRVDSAGFMLGLGSLRRIAVLDLITPARAWAVAAVSPDPSQEADATGRMPALQRAVMFVSVVGPFCGLLAAIALLWHRAPGISGIGWPEIIVMAVMYALCGFGVT